MLLWQPKMNIYYVGETMQAVFCHVFWHTQAQVERTRAKGVDVKEKKISIQTIQRISKLRWQMVGLLHFRKGRLSL
jgi:hypothetical protein